jgi:hypothetical protein
VHPWRLRLSLTIILNCLIRLSISYHMHRLIKHNLRIETATSETRFGPLNHWKVRCHIGLKLQYKGRNGFLKLDFSNHGIAIFCVTGPTTQGKEWRVWMLCHGIEVVGLVVMAKKHEVGVNEQRWLSAKLSKILLFFVFERLAVLSIGKQSSTNWE